MKRAGILHAELAGHLARLSHTDLFVVADSGFPVPPGVPTVDLRVIFGLPRLEPVLEAVLAEVVVEAAAVASEVDAANSELAALFDSAAPGATRVPHDELKRLSTAARFVIRTAEATPYGNILLTAGVAFDV
ncbi:D-ribose pyranase [Herbiconiux sp. KACC 21604]|uniref:D-ribose pyranase n=1 Tax=unclassified Herbiconiux TaxID=2618217 RepID=UPI001490C156|nr:D-ribose pyranase [Herbiconiux sp. SALV-R1]QJU55730.1 D-ribose pyranase [Herbiconiux sp. SALV-R1]WPO86938.1 D-ribose pyranase [Herbiconiux sp. KACC 21604]